MAETKKILAEFIECYKANRILWDTTNKDYLNKNKKATGYAELLNILKKMKVNATIEDVKRKINTLRSAFRKELKKVKKSECSGAGTDSVYVPSLWWYDMFKFIEHLEKPVDSVSTMDDLDEQSSNFENETLIAPLAKKSKSSTQEEMLSLACNYLKNGTEDNDPFYFMARTWTNKLKNLSRIQQLRVEKKINDVFYEAEMNDISRGLRRSAESAQISTTEDNSLLEDISFRSSRTSFTEYGSNSLTSFPIVTIPPQQIVTMSLISPDQLNANLISTSNADNIAKNFAASGTNNVRNYLKFNEY